MTSQYFSLFIEEANELWPEGAQALASDDANWRDQFLRTAHTLKGMAGTMGYSELADAFHRCEDLTNTNQSQSAISEVWDAIGGALDRATSTQSEDALRLFGAGTPAHDLDLEPEPVAGVGPETGIDTNGTNDVEVAIDIEPDDLLDAEAIDAEEPEQREKTQDTASKPAPVAATPVLRVNVDKLDTMFDTVGQLHARMRVLASAEYGSASWEREMRTMQALITRSIHHVAGVRLSSLRPLADLFEKSLNDASERTGKPVEFYQRGVNVRIAREVVERLRPLIPHIARNAIAHGIEDAATRQMFGKPPGGRVEFSAVQDGAAVVLVIRDDGGGVDLGQLRLKATEKGIPVPSTDKECLELLFHPGFSTKSSADDLAGRGVGLDAVKEAIESVGGTVSMQQEQQQFFEIKMHIPVPLSLQRIVQIDAGGVPIGILDDDWEESDGQPTPTDRVFSIPGIDGDCDLLLRSKNGYLPVAGWERLGAMHLHRLSAPLDQIENAIGFYVDVGGLPRIVYALT